jgi:phage shock protein A
MDETSQAIGELRSEVANLKEQVSELRAEVQQLLAIMNAAKGSWRTLAVLGGAVLAVAGLAVAAFRLFRP